MSELLKQLRRASFRGVPFEVAHQEDAFGRRTETHVYPGLDTGYTEDLGKQLDTFQVDGFVSGTDYIENARRLITACQQAGAGLLVHPWLGSHQVICIDCRPRWSFKGLGECRIQLSFQEEGERRYPDSTQDYALAAKDAAASALETFNLRFSELYRLEGPSWISSEMLSIFQNAMQLLGTVAKVAGIGSAALGDFLDDVQGAMDTAGDFLADADQVSDTVGSLLSSLSGLAEESDSQTALDTMLGLTAISDDLELLEATTSARETLNQAAESFSDLVSRLSVTYGIQAAMDSDFGSRQEALAARDRIITKLDGLIDDASESGDHEAFEALRELSSQVVQAFAQKASGLPNLITRQTPNTPTPAIILAYQLYKDLDREDEILSRNPFIWHPGLLPGGETLEVLDA